MAPKEGLNLYERITPTINSQTVKVVYLFTMNAFVTRLNYVLQV